MLDRGQLLPGMAAVLQEWHDFAEKTFDMRPHAIGESTSYLHLFFFFSFVQVRNYFYPFTVYLATSPAVAYERITRRARVEETPVPYDYIEQLHQLHSDWITREYDAMMQHEASSTDVSET